MTSASRFGSRKFLLALLVILLASGLLFLKLLDGAQWVTVVGSALLFYSASNVAQKFSQPTETTP